MLPGKTGTMNSLTMSRRERLRRVIILCDLFTRNLAYYREASCEEWRHLFGRLEGDSDFWRMAANNCIDMCILEWCKLFGSRREEHHWSRIASDPAAFEIGLQRHLRLDKTAFHAEVGRMRTYRDKFVAHLDSDRDMFIPVLNVAKEAVWFYHSHVVNHEAKPGDLAAWMLELDPAYECYKLEAREVYRRNSIGIF